MEKLNNQEQTEEDIKRAEKMKKLQALYIEREQLEAASRNQNTPETHKYQTING